jgi:hypothetical protein
MSSMFGGFGSIHQLGQPGGVTISVGAMGGGPGGFPGIFPAGGVSNSGWAGINQFSVRPCTTEDLRTGRCTLGPPPELSGK